MLLLLGTCDLTGPHLFSCLTATRGICGDDAWLPHSPLSSPVLLWSKCEDMGTRSREGLNAVTLQYRTL